MFLVSHIPYFIPYTSWVIQVIINDITNLKSMQVPILYTSESSDQTISQNYLISGN